ncbi:MAG: GNAT family N-acetyltransferase [Anaerolineae bacterium]|nr:GNAT family N-acetyltransferase [Anaerolineae bacterium]
MEARPASSQGRAKPLCARPPGRTTLSLTPKPPPPFTIRAATPQDARALLASMQHLLSEPGHNLRLDADEFTLTEQQEAAFIEALRDAPNSTMVLAQARDAVVGVLTLQGGKSRAEAHLTALGISVGPGWRGRGIGSALWQACQSWLMNTPQVRQVLLCVLARNLEAVRLYQRWGFVEEGRLQRDMFRAGQYVEYAGDGPLAGQALAPFRGS